MVNKDCLQKHHCWLLVHYVTKKMLYPWNVWSFKLNTNGQWKFSLMVSRRSWWFFSWCFEIFSKTSHFSKILMILLSWCQLSQVEFYNQNNILDDSSLLSYWSQLDLYNHDAWRSNDIPFVKERFKIHGRPKLQHKYWCDPQDIKLF